MAAVPPSYLIERVNNLSDFLDLYEQLFEAVMKNSQEFLPWYALEELHKYRNRDNKDKEETYFTYLKRNFRYNSEMARLVLIDTSYSELLRGRGLSGEMLTMKLIGINHALDLYHKDDKLSRTRFLQFIREGRPIWDSLASILPVLEALQEIWELLHNFSRASRKKHW